MNQKPASIPILSLSMSASSGVLQFVKDESQSVSAATTRRGAAQHSTAIHAPIISRLTRCGCVDTPRLERTQCQPPNPRNDAVPHCFLRQSCEENWERSTGIDALRY